MFGESNEAVMLDIEALIEQLNHGRLDVSYDIHGKKIVRCSVFGQKRDKYLNNEEAVIKILEKVKEAIKSSNDSSITFTVKVSKNKIKDVFWYSTFEKVY